MKKRDEKKRKNKWGKDRAEKSERVTSGRDMKSRAEQERIIKRLRDGSLPNDRREKKNFLRKKRKLVEKGYYYQDALLIICICIINCYSYNI